jgi:Putative peptidoglycan binding domain
MRTILCWAGIAALAALGLSADVATPAKKTATSPKKTVTMSPASAAKKKKSAPSKTGASPSKTGVSKGATASRTTASHPAATKTGPRTAAARRGKKGPPAKRVTWRNRQLAPTPQRYKEIQDALAAKGYLNPEDANGAWNQASVDALKKFQAGQNLDSTGKINSLSLIALGLGPRRETPPPKPPAESTPAPPQ